MFGHGIIAMTTSYAHSPANDKMWSVGRLDEAGLHADSLIPGTHALYSSNPETNFRLELAKGLALPAGTLGL